MLSSDLLQATRDMNEIFKQRAQDLPSRETRRDSLQSFSEIKNMRRLKSDQVRKLTRESGITAVDGSRVEYGTVYPYAVALMQALARNSLQKEDYQELKAAQLMSPIEPDTYNEITRKAAADRLDEPEAYRRLLKDELAHMELKLALSAVERYRPALLMLDGGFLMFDRFSEWQGLIESCKNNNTILVGVIEEVATAELNKMCGLYPEDTHRIYDREFLFGVLDQGECLILDEKSAIKRDYATVFTRMGAAPQAIACDFIPHQRDLIELAMDLLYSLTPMQGRGIPSWLDIIDRDVRITRQNLDTVIAAGFDAQIRERFLRPNRDRRGL
ncbi:MAG: DNA double-strand break repair nuclease NurA [Acidobacteriota bacterium]